MPFSTVSCDALTGLVFLLHSNEDFSFDVVFSKTPKSFSLYT